MKHVDTAFRSCNAFVYRDWRHQNLHINATAQSEASRPKGRSKSHFANSERRKHRLMGQLADDDVCRVHSWQKRADDTMVKSCIGLPCFFVRLHAAAAQKFVVVASHQPVQTLRGGKTFRPFSWVWQGWTCQTTSHLFSNASLCKLSTFPCARILDVNNTSTSLRLDGQQSRLQQHQLE